MRVCVIGSGGREHALASVLSRSSHVVVTPGNPAMSSDAISCSPALPEDIEADLYVIGPEAPLVDGLADRLRSGGRLVFGPGADGARLEGSKAWMKQVLAEAGIPTARHASVQRLDQARDWLAGQAPPYVVKTDGLAAGKGVLVTQSLEEALADAEAKLSGRVFGGAGSTVVLEQALDGEELSLLAVCDGQRALPLAPAQDFKRLGNGDTGPNTGGMGAYSPVPVASDGTTGEVMDTCVEPLLAQLRRMGIDYRGVLYAGLMLTDDGPMVVEFNVRFGDPEAQVVLPRLESDLGELLGQAAAGHLASQPSFDSQACVTVVLASQGYPENARTGDVISGLDEAGKGQGVLVFHAGTTVDPLGRAVTAGGRVLDVGALAPDLASARRRAYDAVSKISWDGVHYRGDIAQQAAEELAGRMAQ